MEEYATYGRAGVERMHPSAYAGGKIGQTAAMSISQGQPYNVQAGGNWWSTGLCHCCDDPANCLITCLCPCITFGQVAEIVNQGEIPCGVAGGIYAVLLGTGLACLYSCVYRSRLRAQYNLVEAPTADCLVHFCCEACALCQEYRELKARGFDMSIGWQANMARGTRPAVVTVAPPIGAMYR